MSAEYKVHSIAVHQFFTQCLDSLGKKDPFTTIRSVAKINEYLYTMLGTVVNVEYDLFGVRVVSFDFGGVDSNSLLKDAFEYCKNQPAYLAGVALREYVRRTLKDKVGKDVDIVFEINPPKIEVEDFIVRYAE